MAHTPDRDALPSAERLKAFTDAVVAIAMTLLILPLMDSVSELATDETVLGWIGQERDRLITFALSFVLIATFWIGHHRLFSLVDRVSGGLLWLMVLWMFSIVWLPVATAIVGAFPDDDAKKVIYIGSLSLASTVGMLTRVYLMRHPHLHRMDADSFRSGLASDISTVVLYIAALVVSVAVPLIGYWALALLSLSDPVRRLLQRLIPGLREVDAHNTDAGTPTAS